MVHKDASSYGLTAKSDSVSALGIPMINYLHQNWTVNFNEEVLVSMFVSRIQFTKQSVVCEALGLYSSCLMYMFA